MEDTQKLYKKNPHAIINAPNEFVDFNLTLAGQKNIALHFKVTGAASKAKPHGYAGAIISYAIKEKPAVSVDELTKHSLSGRTPFSIAFTDEDRGKYVSVAMRWQNSKQETGPWSDIQSTIIP